MPGTTADQPIDTATAAGGETMQAIVQTRYGTTPETVLRLATIARPTIDDDEVLVRVAAASVDKGTWHVMTGLPYAMRARRVRTPGAQGAQPRSMPRWNGRVGRFGCHHIQDR